MTALHKEEFGRGTDAIKKGLVDELGGMDVAIERAAELAEIEDYKLKYLPTYKKDLEDMFGGFGLIQSKEEILKEELGEANYMLMQRIKKVTEQKGIQLMLPYEIEIN